MVCDVAVTDDISIAPVQFLPQFVIGIDVFYQV